MHAAARQGPSVPATLPISAASVRLALSVLAYGARHDQDSDDRLEQVTALEVQVIAVYAAEDFLCGAKRRFMLKKSAGRQALEPTTWYTQQTRARRDRKRLAELLDKARRIRFG